MTITLEPLGVALFVFVALKLTGSLDWSWAAALSPLWVACVWGILEVIAR